MPRPPEMSTLVYFVGFYFQVFQKENLQAQNHAYVENSLGNLCYEHDYCLTIIDISNFFYILTFSTNFLMFYAFNNKF
jgi:hypothetical protein